MCAPCSPSCSSLAITGVFVFAICYGIFTGFNHYVDKAEGGAATWNANAVQKEKDRTTLLNSQGAGQVRGRPARL